MVSMYYVNKCDSHIHLIYRYYFSLHYEFRCMMKTQAAACADMSSHINMHTLYPALNAQLIVQSIPPEHDTVK